MEILWRTDYVPRKNKVTHAHMHDVLQVCADRKAKYYSTHKDPLCVEWKYLSTTKHLVLCCFVCILYVYALVDSVPSQCAS